MKFIHISDLHLGRKINEYSMHEEQVNVLKQVVETVDNHDVDAVLIAGDIYDKSIPSIEAIELFDGFLMELINRNRKVFIISGNHDSAERLSYASEIFKKNQVYISKAYSGYVPKITMEDEYGNVNVYLIPFVKPAIVKRYHEDAEITDYNSALATVVENMEIDHNERNIVLVHQFITGASKSQSEEVFLGGLDNVDYQVFDGFDYVALGHIHKPQSMGRKEVRYSGSPLKYSVDERTQKKSITIVKMEKKGDLTIDTIPFVPIKDIRKIQGTYMELTDRNNYINTKTDDYLHVVLTDEDDIPDAYRKLRVIYPNILKLEYSNRRTSLERSIVSLEAVRQKSCEEYVKELYEIQNNREMSAGQINLLRKFWEESKGK